MVGALVVDDDGVIVGRGSHMLAGGPHAEIHALNDAAGRARGGTLYCTLEPCSHTGRTGPCAPRVAEAGIRRAVVAGTDPNPRVAGRGLAYLRERGVAVRVGVLQAEAEGLNRPFFTMMQRHRPFVTMKAALSLDGCVAGAPGRRTSMTGPAAASLVHRERAEVDAIAVGSETLLVDDPQLTARVAYRHRPLVRVVFDRRLRTPVSARLLSTMADGPVVIMTGESERVESARVGELRRAGVLVEHVDTSNGSAPFLRNALATIARHGVSSLLVEGGPLLHAAFWRASLVDRVEVFVSPRPVGPGGVPWLDTPDAIMAGLDGLTARPVGDDVLIEGYVHRAD
jgi:diaminohydroxyphosphoribosylaminopyrimidine deaminase/5-amino-6-(5-phosphoribosylamino)uracil reductase